MEEETEIVYTNQIIDLKAAADDVLSGNINKYSLPQLLHSLPERFGGHKTREATILSLAKAYKFVCNSEDFLALRPEDLIKVIQRDDIDIENEDVLVNSVLDWFQYKWEERKVHLADVMEHVRLPLCTDDYLHYVVAEHPYLAQEPGKKYVKEALKYASSCEVYRHEICTPRTIPRDHFDARRKLVILDYNRNGTKSEKYRQIMASNAQNEWFGPPTVLTHPHPELHYGYAACVVPSGILITGGRSRFHTGKPSPDCFLFKTQQNIWIEFPSLNEGRMSHAAVYHNEDILVFWGMNNPSVHGVTSIEIFKAGRSGWKLYVLPPKGDYHSLFFEVVSNGEFIYIFQYSNLFAFHPTKLTFEKKAEWPYHSKVCPVSYNDNVYVVGMDRNSAKYDTLTDTWTVLLLPTVSLKVTNLVIWNAKILVCGFDNDGPVRYNCIVQYDPVTDKGTTDKKLPLPDFLYIFNVKI